MDRFFRWFGLPGSLVLTILMSAFALLLAAICRTPARWLCFAAMALSSVGDVFLMRFGGLDKRFPNYFVIGAAFFMAAHLVYTASFALRIRQEGAVYLNGGVGAALLACLACLLVFLKLGLRPGVGNQLPLVLAYLAVISLNCVTIFSYAWTAIRVNPLAILAAVGAVSFMASDAIIGLGMLAGIDRYDHLIWWLYPIGQLLIIAGAGK